MSLASAVRNGEDTLVISVNGSIAVHLEAQWDAIVLSSS